MVTPISKTIKSSGGDYTTMSNLEAANRDCVSNDEAWTVTASSLSDTTKVTFAGWVLDDTRYLKIKGDGYHSCYGGTQDTSKYRMLCTGGPCITIGSNGAGARIEFEDMQLHQNDTGGWQTVEVQSGDGGGTFVFRRCVIWGKASGGFGITCANSTNKVILDNCVIISGSTSAQLYGVFDVINCTIISTAYHGLNAGATNRVNTIYNCYANEGGAATSAYNALGTSSTMTTSAASDATGDPAALDNIAFDTNNFTDIDQADMDLRLPLGSALIGQGSAVAAGTRDLNGKLRNPLTPDLGAIEYRGYTKNTSAFFGLL